MNAVYRAAAVYLFLLVVMRIAGKRTMSEITTFDFVLLLIIGEAVQQALLGDDFSLTTAFVVVATLIVMDMGIALAKTKSKRIERLVEDVPLVICEHGTPLLDRLKMVEVDEEDILAAARQTHGLERMDQIKYAVLERNGGISIIPKA